LIETLLLVNYILSDENNELLLIQYKLAGIILIFVTISYFRANFIATL